MKPRNIPEVPTKLDNGPQHRQLLVAMREQIVQLTGRLAIPAPPSNVAVTPQAFQNTVVWSKSNDADYYEVRVSNTSNQNDASAFTVDVGNSAIHQDTIGNAITRYYWIRACKYTGAVSPWSTLVKGTALAAGTRVTPPNPPQPGTTLVEDQVTGAVAPAALRNPRTQSQN